MDALEFLKEKKLIDQESNSFTIIKDEIEYNLLDILNEYKKDSDDKYIRLLAEFDNYKKRVNKEKEDLKNKIKLETLSLVLELNDDIYLSIKSLDESTLSNINPILSKFKLIIEKSGLEEIQTDKYDEDIHEVVSAIPGDEVKIIDVLSKGYKINDKIVRYPKVIISKNE